MSALHDRIASALDRREAHVVAELWRELEAPARLALAGRREPPPAPAVRDHARAADLRRAEAIGAGMEAVLHESGHALVARALGVPVEGISVVRDARSGETRHLLPVFDPWDQPALIWAGPLAEESARRLRTVTAWEVLPRLSVSDWEGIEEVVRADDREHYRIFGDIFSPKSLAAFEQARAILLARRPALLALAAQLRHHGSLTGREIDAILQGHP